MNQSLAIPAQERLTLRERLAGRATVLAIWLLLLAGVVREVLGQSEIGSIGTYTLHSIDAAFIAAVAAALLHLTATKPDWRPFTLPIAVFAGLILFNFLRGFSADPAPALLWLRAYGTDAAILLLAILMRPSWPVLRSARTALIACAVLLIVLEILRLASHPALFMISGISDADANDGGRPLTSFGTFLMVTASAVLTSEAIARRRLTADAATVMAAILPLAILLTRQGTAIAAELVVLATIIFLQRGRMHGRRVALAGGAAVAAFGLLALVFPLLAGSAELARRTNNLELRQRIWESLIDGWPYLPWSTQLLGYPAGQMPPIVIYARGSYRLWTNSIHSMYFGALPMAGYLGLIAFCTALVLLSAEALKRSQRRRNPLPAFPLALCLGSAVMCYSYELRGDALIGLLLAIASLRLAAQADRADAPHRRGVGSRFTHRAPPLPRR